MNIKKLTRTDIDDVACVFMDVFNSAPWHDNWTLESAKNRLDEIIMTPHFYGYLSKNNQDDVIGAMLGNLSTGPTGRVYCMYEFFTVEKYRSQKVGQNLYNALLQDLRQTNCKGIFLTTKKDTAAFNFYSKNGLFELKNSSVMFGLI